MNIDKIFWEQVKQEWSKSIIIEDKKKLIKSKVLSILDEDDFDESNNIGSAIEFLTDDLEDI